jgi:hypothetical protein
MDYETYVKEFVVDPSPPPRFAFEEIGGVALFFADFEAAVAYYEAVLGPPGYVEGLYTRSWRLGTNWLTLLKGEKGAPQNVEVILNMSTPEAAEALQRAFIDAGGVGEPPSDQLMYDPIRYCPVRDPFDTNILVISPLR